MKQYIDGLVSVIIPTRGRSDTLHRAITSALNQTYSFIEVLVVDDNDKGSENANIVKRIIENFSDERLSLITQDRHINGAAARNAGIKRSNGEYIAFLDDDDWWELCKIEHQLKCFEMLDKSYGAVTCLKKYYIKGNVVRASLPHKDGYICKEVAARCIGLSMGAPLIRRSALDETGYFDENLSRMQDVQLFSCLCSKYKVYLLKKYLYCISGDDAQNRSGANKVKDIKAAFLNSISYIIDEMPKEDKEFVKIMTEFDMGYSFLKEHNYSAGVPLILGVLRQREAFRYAIHRVVARGKAKFFKAIYLERYK